MDRIDKLISVAELKDMTEDEWGIHLFAESVDQQMVKIAIELLVAKDPKILDIKRRSRKWKAQFGMQDTGKIH